MPRHDSKTATLVQTLVFYDGPQLALFKTDQGRMMLALAVAEPGEVNPFFCCEMTDTAYLAYKAGRQDLNFVFRYSRAKRLYFADWSSMDGRTVNLRRAKLAELKDESLYPERGFFEDDHTEEWLTQDNLSVRRRFAIQGRWDANDFSKFYNKLGNVYSLMSLAEDLGDENVADDERRRIQNALMEPTWGGGGSYVGFYADIETHSNSMRPLRIAGIEYHSPGHIEVEGRETVLSELDRSIKQFEENDQNHLRLYTYLNQILASEGLKKRGVEHKFSSEELDKFALEHSLHLAQLMLLANPEKIFTSCGSNTVVFTKVVLSFYRRLNDLYKFQKEGRLTIGGVEQASPIFRTLDSEFRG